jgi:NAD-dependent deacetylase
MTGPDEPVAAGESPFPAALVNGLRQARHVVVLTGAGISAESGVPTFRQTHTGLWAHYDPQELATPAAFKRDPKLVWDWYEWRRHLIEAAAPNAGHLALAALERRVPRFTLITQNIDALHQRAGSQRVIELHGSIFRRRCFDEDTLVEMSAPTDETPPRCPSCGGPIRPDVVWFGEPLPPSALGQANDACLNADIFFSIGTSAVVFPAAALPLDARRNGAMLVEINPERTPLTAYAEYYLGGPAGVVLPGLLDAAWP